MSSTAECRLVPAWETSILGSTSLRRLPAAYSTTSPPATTSFRAKPVHRIAPPASTDTTPHAGAPPDALRDGGGSATHCGIGIDSVDYQHGPVSNDGLSHDGTGHPQCVGV